jgi:hypothetical protein
MEETTTTTSSINKFYYKTDFVQIVSVADNAVLPFTLTYFTVEGGNTFVASFDGTKYTNCQRTVRRKYTGYIRQPQPRVRQIEM